jgi:hypothetical protein
MQNNKITIKENFIQKKNTPMYDNKNKVKITFVIETNNSRLNTDDLINKFTDISIDNYEKVE